MIVRANNTEETRGDQRRIDYGSPNSLEKAARAIAVVIALLVSRDVYRHIGEGSMHWIELWVRTRLLILGYTRLLQLI